MFGHVKARKYSERGFTLVELLIVIVIIGVLAAIAIPIFLNQRAQVRDIATLGDLRGVFYNINEAMFDCPAADKIDISRLNTSNVGSIGNKQSVTYDTWIESPDEIFVGIYNSNNTGKRCFSDQLRMSPGTVLFVTDITGQPGQFSIYAWNPEGKLYAGGDYRNKADVVQGYERGEVAKFDFGRGRIVKHGT